LSGRGGKRIGQKTALEMGSGYRGGGLTGNILTEEYKKKNNVTLVAGKRRDAEIQHSGALTNERRTPKISSNHIHEGGGRKGRW